MACVPRACLDVGDGQLSRSRAALRDRSRQNRGGYDCEFVSPPPEAIQAECPICFSILKEPCLISCPCGQKICRECVERIKNDKKPCPLCNKTDFTFLRDHGLERQLKAQDVFCSKKKLGCQWKGKLGDFEEHLNKNPSPEEQLTGCRFVEVECKHGCGEWYERHFIHAHQNEECPQRLLSCEYCKEYDSTFEDVTTKHHAICGKYPVTCPNKCNDDLWERSSIESHLNNECPLNKVSCSFAYAGCEVKLLRKDMPGHTADIFTHFPLLASYTRQIDQKQSDMKRYFEEMLKAQNQVLEEKLKVIESKVALLEDTHQIKSALGKFPIDFQVNLYEKKEFLSRLFLPPFFTHPHGYKMCFRVDPNGNSNGKGTHVSVFIYLMQGPFDYQLKWPFRGEVTIQIVNQVGDHSHFERTIEFNSETQGKHNARVIGKERADTGLGRKQFLAHTELGYNAAKKTQYLKDSIMLVRAIQVKLTE